MMHYPGGGDLTSLPVILDQPFWIVDYSGENLKTEQPEPFERGTLKRPRVFHGSDVELLNNC